MEKITIERVAEAIERRDCDRAKQLLQEFQQQEPDHPWSLFYDARIEEMSGNLTVAEQKYRELLCNAANAKIIAQARQGIDRLAQIESKQRQQARDRARAESDSQESGVLVIEPIEPELKQAAAKKFAKIVQIEPYLARLQLPSRSWRMYRTGAMGDLRFYTDAFREAEIPCFCLPIDRIKAISVYRVRYFQADSSQATAICQTNPGQQETIHFDWSEVNQRVEALLPLFEQCVDLDVRGKLIRKTQVQDYAKFCDLHLTKRNLILRLCDRGYQFQEGMSFFERQNATDGQRTLNDKWNHLMQYVRQHLADIPVWSDFNAFAATAMDFPDTLRAIEPHNDLLRPEKTDWDSAFQLYSALVLAKNIGS